MAIVFIEQLKKQKYLILTFVTVILATVFVLWRGFFTREKPPVETLPLPVKKVEINFEIFKNPLLEEFEAIKKIVPETGLEPGRDNPFLPY